MATLARLVEPPGQSAARIWASRAATASRCCCRRRRRPPSATSRPTSWAPSRCRCSRCSDRRRCNTGWPIPAPRPSSPIAMARRSWRRSAASLPDLTHVLCIDGAAPGCRDLAAELAGQPADVRAGRHRARTIRRVIIYTSGTTGQPKGALHAHRVLLGHLPGVEMSHDLLPQPGDRIWTPADWAWIGGLLDVLLPALHHGVPVVARRFEKFTGEAAFQLIQDFGIRNAFLPPTALEDDARGAGAGEALAPRHALDRQRRRDLGRGADRVGQAGVRPHHQRVLRPDRMQHDRLVLRAGDAGAARHHGPRRPRPSPRDRGRRRRGVPPDGDAGQHRGAPARPGDVPGILAQPGGDGGQVRRRLAADRRHRRDGCRRLDQVRRPRRRRHHLGRLSHRAGRDRGLPAGPSGGAPRRRRRQAGRRRAPRSSRPTSC